ncbi:MAG: tRNA pseudouridine synthase 10 [Thermoproteota archaeon]|nr:tRNA pseudouridine synthase 10 [Thermoproteota archaeon]
MILIVDTAEELLGAYVLCDNCLGRQFAMLSHGFTNKARGEAIKNIMILEGSRLVDEGDRRGRKILGIVAVNGLSNLARETLKTHGIKSDKKSGICYVCSGTFEFIDEFAKNISEILSEYEYQTFLIGIKIPNEVEEREDELRARFNIRWGESIRNEFSREVGKKVAEITGRTPDHEKPETTVILNPFTKKASVESNPLYVEGRYKKLVRGLSQIRRICSECSGKGCQVCGWTGKQSSESIEELITLPIMKKTKGLGGVLHAAGREGLDVRVLGKGRRFIVEIKNPRVRNIDMQPVQNEINKEANGRIEVSDLKLSSREGVKRLKEEEGVARIYSATVEFARDVTDEELKRLKECLDNKFISQTACYQTMRTRKKYLYEVKIKRLKFNVIEMLVQCQGGLSIRELISGDDGRTSPSVADIIDASAKCIQLDVMDVHVEVD